MSPAGKYPKPLTNTLSTCASIFIHWTTPRQQLTKLLKFHGKDFIEWEHFRDNFCRKCFNLNVMCGLVMGAVSTIVFSDYPLSPAGFALGIISLLSSLIATGFGVGLIYVLGDVKGLRYQNLMMHHPNLFIFAIVIPQTWTFVSFVTFFLTCAVTFWEATNKSWFLKAGVMASVFCITIHLAGFLFVFRPDNPNIHDLRPQDPTGINKPQRRETVFGVEVTHGRN